MQLLSKDLGWIDRSFPFDLYIQQKSPKSHLFDFPYLAISSHILCGIADWKTQTCSSSSLANEGKVFIRQFGTSEEDRASDITLDSLDNVYSEFGVKKMLSIAEGRAKLFPCLYKTKTRETAAAQLICEEAGCSVLETDTKKPLTYHLNKYQNSHFIVMSKN